MENTSYKSYIREITKYPLLSAEEEKDLSIKIFQGDKGAQQLLINSNLRYVVSIAHKYTSNEDSLMDCIQEGNLGLMIAASRYDHTFNTRFCTYANSWITQYILRHKTLSEPLIHIPALKLEKLKAISNAACVLEQKLGKIPTNQELSIYTGIEEGVITDLKSYSYTTCSIDGAMSGTEETSLLKYLSDETANPEQEYFDRATRHEYMTLIEQLPANERVVMTNRYNSYIDGNKTSFKKMGGTLGLSIEATRQIEIRAKRKLQNIVENHFFDAYNVKIPV